MYVFVRCDLSWPQRVVQSCHAAIEATKAFDIAALSDHPSVIVIGVPDEDRLHRVRKYLVDHAVRHVHFYESDRNDELTALATEPVFGERRRLFRRFQLLREKTTEQKVT